VFRLTRSFVNISGLITI